MRWFKRGDEMEANDTGPINLSDQGDGYSGSAYTPDMTRRDPHGQTEIYDGLPVTDRAMAEDVIAASRAEGWSGETGEDDTTPPTDQSAPEAETIRQFLESPERLRSRVEELRMQGDQLVSVEEFAARTEVAGEPVKWQQGEYVAKSEVFRDPLAFAPSPGRHILGDPIVARTAVPQAIVSIHREPCVTCDGSGHMPSVSDLLRESAGWIEDMDAVVRYFYTRLLDLAREDAEKLARDGGYPDPLAAGQKAVDDLVFLFPPDLLGADEIHGQRDKLAEALVGLATLYDPTDASKMERLDTIIKSMASRHAAFARRDGTIQGVTGSEYDLAWRALSQTLATLGDRFSVQHAESWRLAYDYVAGGMMQYQQISGATAPRFPRA